MKKIVVLILLVCVSVNAQNLLKPEWKIKTGDDLSWAKVEVDDSDWMEILAGESWEGQGLDNYDGYAWYRQAITVSKEHKQLATENGGFVLKLGRIDDSDQIFLNGELIAEHGKLPPEYDTGYHLDRIVSVPVEKIKWNKKNIIAVRVYDGGGGGGIYQGPVEFRIKGLEDLFTIEPQFAQKNRIFVGNKKIVIPVKLSNDYKQTIQGKLIKQEDCYHTLSYIDIKNLAPWIKVPVFMTIGLVDETCPPHTNFAAYNQLTVPKEYHVYPTAGHGMPGEYNDLKYNWIKKQFGME